MGLTMGLGDAGYVLDRYGFPWQAYLDDAEKRRNGKDPSGDSRQELFDDGNFGLVVFRRESAGRVEYLAIYLVGEVASVGVPQSSLRRALLHAVHLPPAGGRPLLIGPTFSGSVYSVVTALDGFAQDYAHWALVHAANGYCKLRGVIEARRLRSAAAGKYGDERHRRVHREDAQALGEWLAWFESQRLGVATAAELCRITPVNGPQHARAGAARCTDIEQSNSSSYVLKTGVCTTLTEFNSKLPLAPPESATNAELRKFIESRSALAGLPSDACEALVGGCGRIEISLLSYSATASSNAEFAESFGRQMDTLALADTKKLDWLNARLSDLPCKPGTGACEVAILAEASVFGQGICGAYNSQRAKLESTDICKAALQVSFPSNISDIRYRRSERRARDGKAIAERLPLPRQWDDALALSDGVENGSEFPDSQLSPLTHASVELQLELALQRVQAANPRVVLIAATDVRDRLYLIERMRQILPRAQMVDLEADVLLAHPRHSLATRGTLMLASAPLRVQGLSNGQAFARAFTSDEQALLYCLARMLPGADPITREACLKLLKGDEFAPEPWIVTRVGSQPVDASDRSTRSCSGDLWCGPPRIWTLALQSLKSGVSIHWALLWATLGLLLAAACVSGALGKLRAALCAMVNRWRGTPRRAEKEQPGLASTANGLIKPQRSPQTLLSAVWGAIQRSCMDPVISVADCSSINWALLQGFPRFLYLVGSALFATYLYTMLPALWPRMDLANAPWEGRILAILVQLLALGTILLTVITGHQFTVIRRLAGTIHMLVLRSTGAAFGTWDRVPPAPIRFGFTVILAHPGPDPGDATRDVIGLHQRLAHGYVDTLPNRLTLRWMFAQRLTRLRWTLVATAICPLALLAVCWSYPIAARDNVLGFGLLMALACAFFLVYATRSLDRDAVLSPLMINQRPEASETLQGYALMVAPFVLLALIFLVMESPATFEGAPGLLAWLWSLLT